MDRAALKTLIAQKDAMEKEMLDLNEALSASNLGGVSTPVIDAEGFPRADIDVHTTLTLRNRLARLNTDHKELMSRIEQGLLGALPAQPRQQPTGGAGRLPIEAHADLKRCVKAVGFAILIDGRRRLGLKLSLRVELLRCRLLRCLRLQLTTLPLQLGELLFLWHPLRLALTVRCGAPRVYLHRL